MAALCLAVPVHAAERLVLVTVDGLSWTDVFRGANLERAADKAFAPEPAAIKPFVEAPDRARALTPFLHDVVAKQGVLLGDRDHGSCVAVANDQWFSYPGYNEILTGRPDPKITSNAHGPNANVTFLEWLNRRPEFRGRVEAVTSWDAFQDILNAPRNGLAVNAGWAGAPRGGDTDRTRAELQRATPHLWPSARFDAFTHAYAVEALRRDKPRVLYIAYNDTDDFAHDGLYDQVLLAAHRQDAFLAELWKMLQADPAYAGKTDLIVTTDHGRGTEGREAWRSHGRVFAGSDATWLAAIGPDVKPGARPAGACASSSQIAATALVALGFDWKAFDPAAGAPLEILRGR
jgi:hypothetical protein